MSDERNPMEINTAFNGRLFWLADCRGRHVVVYINSILIILLFNIDMQPIVTFIKYMKDITA